MTKVIYPKLVKMTTNLLDFDKNSDINFMTQKSIIKAFKIALSLKKKKKEKSNIFISHHFNTMFLFPFKTLCIAYQDLIYIYIYIYIYTYINIYPYLSSVIQNPIFLQFDLL